MNKLDNELFEKLAVDAVKYQNFRIDCVIDKLDYPLSNGTLKQYLDSASVYIRSGVRHKSIPSNLYIYIDAALAKYVQPLTPSKYEKRKVYKRDCTKKEQIPPVARMEITNKDITESFVYGVKLNNIIRVFDSEKEMNIFLEGFKFANPEQQPEFGTVKFDVSNN